MERDESSLSPSRSYLCLNKEMKMKFENNIEFNITHGDWKATSQLPVYYSKLAFSVLGNACMLYICLQVVAAAQFWHKWIGLDVTVEFEHGDEHRTNECIADISQGDQSVALVMYPRLVWDSPENRVSEILYFDEIVLQLKILVVQ